jgi:hypothetical protein
MELSDFKDRRRGLVSVGGLLNPVFAPTATDHGVRPFLRQGADVGRNLDISLPNAKIRRRSSPLRLVEKRD